MRASGVIYFRVALRGAQGELVYDQGGGGG